MRSIAIAAAALLIVGSASVLTGGSAAAQGVSPNGVIFQGQGWTMPQDFSTSGRMQAAQGSGSAGERAARAARQARFNQHFPGTPIRRTGSSR